jgi:hypothetical protein
MKIKAVLSDFDGTLVNDKDNFSQKTKFLVNKLKEKNVRFSLATGRAYYGKIEKTVNDLGIKGIHIVHGGGAIIDSTNNKFCFKQDLTRGSIKKICDYLESEKVIFGLETDTFMFISPVTHTSIYLQSIETKDIRDYKGREDIYKVLIFSSGNKFDEKTANRHIKNIQKLSTDIEIIRFKFLYDGMYCFGADITSEKATKHTAVLEYCRILGLKPEEVVAMGDGYNDYPLFTAAGFKIAMGNAHKELKEIADLVVAPIDEGGTEEALSYIIDKLI